MERKITSKNLGKKIEIYGRVFEEEGNIYIVERYSKAKVLNPRIFGGRLPNYAKIEGKLTLSFDLNKYPEFAIEVENYET